MTRTFEDTAPRDKGTGVEWPTVAVAALIYGGWLALTWWHAALPTALIAVAGGWLVAWHGSLQHETIHGHPTRWRAVNAAIGAVPLSLWLPYDLYRDSHVAHHRSPHITDPLADPESRYVASGRGPRHVAARVQATLLGRLLVGPFLTVLALAADEAHRLLHRPGKVARDWLPHLVPVVPIAAWLEWTGFGLVRYALLVVYPGLSLTLLRSFAEHRADLPGPSRAATVERAGSLGLLYLNNHLHTAHHDRPDLAWYRLPAHQRHHHARLSAQARRGYRSYGEIVRRFALAPHDALIHPGRQDR
ncbi:fatty acid desaturase [Sphingomonas melonis]|uniref:Fatty acid desaturase n=1 Tax=Sphingomonas melonis TaxID=152682 RepID=A0A0D1MAR6_9SPHN|nr:fatty acid desaturase [Sphingomonas melonis]KIU27662.1 fatty acid desaturase [Sphingomonas melonis]